MAKRTSKVAGEGRTRVAPAPTPTAAGMERRVLAFARQVGYVAGTIQVKTGSLMDREALTRQLASVRDGAAQLLDQLGRARGKASKRTPSRAARKTTGARSGGTVDAPGKQHRKRPPSDPGATRARRQARKMAAATARKSTLGRHRNRG